MKNLLALFPLLLWAGGLLSQNRTLSGTVRDTAGNPLSNVSVVVRGLKSGTSTDLAGNFTLSISSSDKVIVFSSIGFASKEVTVSDQATLTIFLSPANNGLEEVVVTGYTREKKSTYSGAAARVEARAVNDVPMASVDQILQGRAPGLYVAAGSGQPGDAATVVIRGVGTINGDSEPLYILDGIPIEGSNFTGINPSEIASVDVLKDAVATSLYGSRGSNGVIVITTKRGKNTGRIVFGMKAQGGFSTRTRPKFTMLDGPQRIQYEEEIGLESGVTIGPGWFFSRNNPANASLPSTVLGTYDKILDSLRNVNYDWVNEFFRKGSFQEYEVNASGGNDRVSFYSSMNYFKQDGIARRSSLERYSLRNNLDIKADRFTAALSSLLSYSHSSFIESEATTSPANPFAAVYYALPYEVPYIDGVLVDPGNAQNYGVFDQREGSVALSQMLATTNKRDQIKGVLSGNFRYSIAPGLSAISTLGLDFRDQLTERYINPNTYTGTLVSGNQGSFAEQSDRLVRLTGNAGFNFSKVFDQQHLVDVSALYESIKTNSRIFNYTGYGLNPLLSGTPAAITPGSTSGFIPTIGGGREITALQSAIAIGKYVFAEKYTLNANFRYDGASSVPKSKRWHSFYSVGASWNLLKEGFMQKLAVVSDLQLRLSYGLSASPFTSAFGYLATYATSKYAGLPGISLATIGNQNYDWEYAKTANIGIDFSLLNKRIRGTVDVYNKKTENLFINQQLPAETGATSMDVNAGTMDNRGIEIALSGDIVATQKFRWTIGLNASYNKNEITALAQVNEFELGTSIVRVGLPLGSHYLPKWAGVDAATGNPLYYNRDGSITTDFNSATQSVAEFGTYLPKYQGGFNTGLTYGGFYLDGFFSFSYGNKRFNNEDYFNENPSFAASNQSIQVLQRWRKPGDITNIQKFGTPRQFSSKDVQDCSYLRFRNLNIGYRVPREAVLKYAKIFSAITIYAQGQNLLTWTTWTGFDPEGSSNLAAFDYPNARTYTLGLNLSL